MIKSTRFTLSLVAVILLGILGWFGKADVVAYPIVALVSAYAGAKSFQHVKQKEKE